MSQEKDQDQTALIYELINRVKDLTDKMESAFLLDDRGRVDYYGHKLFHKNEQESKRNIQYSKTKIIRDVVTWLAIGALTVVGSLLAQAFILPTIAIVK